MKTTIMQKSICCGDEWLRKQELASSSFMRTPTSKLEYEDLRLE